MLRYLIKERMSDKGFDRGHKLTFEEVAEATGIHRTTLSKIANKKGYTTNTDVLDKLCKYFGVRIEKIVKYIDDDEGSDRDIDDEINRDELEWRRKGGDIEEL